MKYKLNEQITKAVMASTPIVVLEGASDISFYERIVNKENVLVEFLPVESIEGYAGGCESVLKVVNDVSSVSLNDGINISDYFLAIADKDLRCFTGGLIDSPYLLWLKYYSIESHLVDKGSVEMIADRVLGISANCRSDLIASGFFDRVLSHLIDFYYASLDALNGVVDPTYVSDFYYSFSYERLKDEGLLRRLREKRSYLDLFAHSLNLFFYEDALRIVCKGKVLLGAFCNALVACLKDLPSQCGSDLVKKCKCCDLGMVDQCLYRPITGVVNQKIIEAHLKSCCDSQSFGYIRERVFKMKVPTYP